MRKDCCCQPARYCALHSRHAHAIARAEKHVADIVVRLRDLLGDPHHDAHPAAIQAAVNAADRLLDARAAAKKKGKART